MGFSEFPARGYCLGASLVLIACSSAFLRLAPRAEAGTANSDLFCRLFYCHENALESKALEQLRTGGEDATKGAVADLRAAVLRDPAAPERWCDLGQAYAMNGEVENASYCFQRGYSMAPNSPVIRLRLALFYLGARDIKNGLANMSAVLAQIPAYDVAFSYYDRLGIDKTKVLEEGIPRQQRAATAWFYYVSRTGSPDQAAAVWDWVCRHQLMSQSEAADYVGKLFTAKKVQSAADYWSVYWRNLPKHPGNLLLNAGFENPPAPTILDWSFLPSEEAQTARDCTVGREGNCSLRVQFEAKDNLNFHNAWQIAFVTPGRYHFEAYIKVRQITTDEGVRFRIVNAEEPGTVLALTEGVTGSGDWKKVLVNFDVPEGVRALQLQVVRLPSSRFENQIQGVAWIDQADLARVGA